MREEKETNKGSGQKEEKREEEEEGKTLTLLTGIRTPNSQIQVTTSAGSHR